MGIIITLEQLPGQIKNFRLNSEQSQTKKNDNLILLGGCFDILHAGHIDFLKAAKDLGGTVILLLESDKTIHKLKGEGRPVNTQNDRAKVLASIRYVDMVIPLPPDLTNNDYSKLVNTIKPDIIAVTADDPLIERKKEQAEAVHGHVKIVTSRITGYSTQQIISKIKGI